MQSQYRAMHYSRVAVQHMDTTDSSDVHKSFVFFRTKMAIKSILDKSWCMHDFVQPIHMLPEVKCNSYIIKCLKFTTGNYKYSRKKSPLAFSEDTSLPYLTPDCRP